MFVSVRATEVVVVDRAITVVGLSLEDSGFPKQAERIGDLWGVYESEHRANVKGVVAPLVNYGFWFGKPDGGCDYLVGSAVADAHQADGAFASATIPAGRYIKAAFNARDFSALVCGDGIGDSFERAKLYASQNGLRIRQMPASPACAIEVYPHERMCVGMANGPEWGLMLREDMKTPARTLYPEMYTLTPIE